MSGSRKTFDEYYSDMQYFKNVATSYSVAVNFPNHLDICNALYNAGLEVCIVDSRNWSYPKIGIRGNFLSAISSFRRLDSDVLLRSDMFTCGCYVAAVDQQSVRSGGEGLGSFGDGVWRSATGTGGSPVFSGYTFFKLNIFPCQNCGIPLGVNPGSGFPSHSDRKYGGDFVKAMVYPRSSCVLNPWISNMTNMFRWSYNASGTGASNWVNKSDFQKAPCVDQEWIQWVKDEENENGFTFQSVVVFFSGKFKGTTYPMIEDKNYILDVLSAMRSSTGKSEVMRPYFDGANTKVEDLTVSRVLSNWKSEITEENGLAYMCYYEVMARKYKRICILNFIDLAKNNLKHIIDEEEPEEGGTPEEYYPDYDYPDPDLEPYCSINSTLTACPSGTSCPSSSQPADVGGTFNTVEEAESFVMDNLEGLLPEAVESTEDGNVVKRGNTLYYEIKHTVYEYTIPTGFQETLRGVLEQKKAEAADSVQGFEDEETGETYYERTYEGNVISVGECIETYEICPGSDDVFIIGYNPQCVYEQYTVRSDNPDDLSFISIPNLKDFLDEYFPDASSSEPKELSVALTTSSPEKCAPITNVGKNNIYASYD